MIETLTFREEHVLGGKRDKIKFSFNENNTTTIHYTQTESPTPRYIAQLYHSAASLFIPHNYPDSVSSDYTAFQFWDSVQGLCSYLRGILTTHALLKGAGVGKEEASAMAATVQWVYKDGAAMLGGLLFTWLGTNFGTASGFDSNIKGWRLFADVINDVGLSIDIIAPFFPAQFTFLICLAGVFKSLCGVAAGATRAALTSHFAQCGNVADVAAKEGAQETAVTLIGMIAGIQFTQRVGENPEAIITAFTCLTILHVIANYIAVTSLKLKTLNSERFRIALECFNAEQSLSPSLAEVSRRERVWPIPLFSKSVLDHIRIGAPLQRVLQQHHNVEADSLNRLCNSLKQYKFAILPPPGENTGLRWNIVLDADASATDVLCAVYETCQAIRQHHDVSIVKGSFCQTVSEESFQHEFVDSLMKNGWNCDRLLLPDDGFRVKVES